MCTWCHGATGIGLVRLATLGILDTEEVRNDIKISVETTKKHLLSDNDHVCCGNFGRLELLLEASLKFGDEKLFQYTLQKAGELVKLSEINGDFRYNPNIGFTPGFFQGISGIGYQILRLAYPETLPSVLTLN
jgi:lantibiotic modifying enzyme